MKGKNITIGGLFTIFKDEAGTEIDQVQLENLHAFKLAIDQINNQTDILPDHEILYVIRTPYSKKFSSIYDATKELVSNKVLGVVGSLDNFGTDASNDLFTENSIVQSHSMAMGTEFGVQESFPYKVQTVPIDSFEGMVFQSLFCNSWGIERFVIITSSDIFGQKFSIEANDYTYCKMEVPHILLAPPYQDDFSEFINNIKDENPTVFLLSLPPAQAAKLLEQGHEIGLFHEGVQIFTDLKTTGYPFFNSFSVPGLIETILYGLIVVEFFPGHFIYIDKGKKFIQMWNNQTNTVSTCANATDASGSRYLTRPDGVSCVGLDFSTCFSNGSNINPYAAYTYDATNLLLRGFDNWLYKHADLPFEDLHFLIINNTRFEGATGIVDIFEGMPQFENYAQGDREEGHFYKVQNFNADAYNINSNASFVQVGIWSLEESFQPWCDPIVSCSAKLTFNNANNTPPESYPPYAFKTLPQVLKIGGLFTPFNADGSVNMEQVENLNAFLMAVNHINNKTDGLWDDYLPDTQIVTMINGEGLDFSGGSTGAAKLLKGFYNSGVDGIIGALANDATISSQRVGVEHELVQLHSVASAAELGNGRQYVYKIQTCPLETYQGMTIQHLLCSENFNVRKITVFTTYDFMGTNAISELSDCTFCCLELLKTVFIYDTNEQDYSDELAEAEVAGALYYVFIVPAITTARLIEQGYESGLFNEGTQLIGISENTKNDIMNGFIKTSNIPTYMRGFFGIEYFPDFPFYLNSGQLFTEKWKEQPSTTHEIIGGVTKCYNVKDDESSFFLYRSQTNFTLCSGLNYSSYNLDGSSFVSNSVLQTYDATIGMAQGFDLLLKHNLPFTGDNLMGELMYNVSFQGMSGYVKFFEGMHQFGEYGRGSREEGHYYKVWNFQEESYSADANKGFVMTHVWSIEEGLHGCPASLNCQPFVYNTQNNQVPQDQPDAIIVTMKTEVVSTLMVLGVVTGLTIMFMSGMLVMYSRSRLLKASQLPMLHIIMLGEVLGLAKVFIAASPITTSSCIGGLWCAHLAFFMVFAALLLKSWRVNKLVNTKSLKRMKISTTYILKVLGGIVGSLVGYLILLTAVGQPHLNYLKHTSSNQLTEYPYCSYVYPQFQIVLYVLELMLLCYGVKLCWDIKDVPDAINESQYIAAAMAMIAGMSYMAFPILVSQPPWVIQIVAGLGFVCAVFATTLIIFLPKAIILLTGRDLMKDMTIGMVKNNNRIIPGLATSAKDKQTNNINGSQKNRSNSTAPLVINTDSPDGYMGVDTLSDSPDKHQLHQVGKSATAYAISSNGTNKNNNNNNNNNNNSIVNNNQRVVLSLNEIHGTKEQKLQFVNTTIADWNKIKIQLEQQILMRGDGGTSGHSHTSNSLSHNRPSNGQHEYEANDNHNGCSNNMSDTDGNQSSVIEVSATRNKK